jgi:acyl-coenzyme A thioesterase PaaI-like protein
MGMTEEQLATIREASANSFPFVQRCGAQVLELDVGYCKMLMPFEPNVNHVGIMYAGALYTIAELPAGPIHMTTFDAQHYYPIVRDMSIHFSRPALTDVTVEVTLDPEEAQRIQDVTDAEGKCNFEWDTEIVDAHGQVVATTHNVYQLRKMAS